MTCNDTMNLCGIICIDKPENYTSFDVVAPDAGICRTKNWTRRHPLTLWPLVLPLFWAGHQGLRHPAGSEQALPGLLPAGITTDTQDITGKVVARGDRLCPRGSAGPPGLCGDILQLPPMYSAVQVGDSSTT